jgi:hypothetical protein
MNDLFTPTEHAIICDYFCITRPEALLTLDVELPQEGNGIYVEEPNGSQFVEDSPLRNAVARIALGVIQNRLPQWGMVDENGTVTLSRERFERPIRNVVLLPQHLFTINWADSGPGYSWPETYHSTYIPGYDCYLVTAAFDGEDMYGVTELAIGYFDGSKLPVQASADVIMGWWRYLRENSQERWAYVWDEGLIDAQTANAWGELVWPEYSPEVEEECG